jgi:hypothetical protein
MQIEADKETYGDTSSSERRSSRLLRGGERVDDGAGGGISGGEGSKDLVEVDMTEDSSPPSVVEA